MQLFDSNSLFFIKKEFTIIIVLFIVMHIGCATPQSISNSSNSQPTNPNSRALSNSPRITSSTDSDNPSDNYISAVRDELFECINGYDYFSSNNNSTYKYRFIIGDYDDNIVSNQESSLPSSCSSNDGYRTIQIPKNSFAAINLDPVCFNSCSLNCN